MSRAPLFDRIGGKSTVNAMVDAFYERVLADPELARYFDRANMRWLPAQQVRFLTQLLGGPSDYRGRSMKRAHERLAIAPAHFDRAVAHWIAVLHGQGLRESLVAEVFDLLACLKGDISTLPCLQASHDAGENSTAGL